MRAGFSPRSVAGEEIDGGPVLLLLVCLEYFLGPFLAGIGCNLRMLPILRVIAMRLHIRTWLECV